MQMTVSMIAHHEGAHAVCVMALRRRIEIIRVEQDLSAHCLCEQRRARIPAWDSLTAVFEIASDFAGVVAAARYNGEEALDDDDDIEARGGVGDLRNVKCKLALICCDDDAKKRALRARAWDAANRLVENYWGSIAEIAGELIRRRRLFHDDVCRCVRAAGDHILLREQPSAVMPARAHRVVTPWAVSRRDGKLVEIDERGVVRRIITRPARIGRREHGRQHCVRCKVRLRGASRLHMLGASCSPRDPEAA
jgi:hypothetical protein